MNINTLTPIQTKLNVAPFHRRILWIHGAILLLMALGSAINATLALCYGVGVYDFLEQNPIAWTGLIQAYLLMAIIAGLLWLGASEAKMRKWHVVGALAHFPPLIAVIFSWGTLTSLGFTAVAIVSLVFHTFWIVIETIGACYPDGDNEDNGSVS